MKDRELTEIIIEFVLKAERAGLSLELSPKSLANHVGGSPQRIGHVMPKILEKLNVYGVEAMYDKPKPPLFRTKAKCLVPYAA